MKLLRKLQLLSVMGLMGGFQLLLGQAAPYSASVEYQAMMEELRRPDPSPAFMATGVRPEKDAHLRAISHEDRAMTRIRSGAFTFSIDKATSVLGVENVANGKSWRLACGGPTPVSGVTREGNTWRIVAGGSTMELALLKADLAKLACTSNNQAEGHVLLHVEGGGPYFGLGERFPQAGLAGTKLDVRPADHYGEPGHNWVYVAVPFLYGPSGLGLYADTVFDTSFVSDDKGSGFDLNVAHPTASFFLFSGAHPKAVLTEYTALTGRPQMPPLWSFGPWIVSLQGKDAVLAMAQKIRDEKIPASALWIYDQLDDTNNLGWPFWFLSYYGDPRQFNDLLHARGYKVLGYVHPYVRERMMPYTNFSPTYEKGVSEKLLQTGPDGLPTGPPFEPVRTGNIDFTNPRAVDWWQGMITAAVRDQGYDGWMEDFGEWVSDQDRFLAGNGVKISEVYPLLYHKITLRVAQALNADIAPFSRSGSSGSQQFSPVLWGADQFHDWSKDLGLPSVITAGITAGMSGYSTWGPDILSEGESRELWTRWVQFGALTPVMRDHVWSKPQYSINLWTDAETRETFRKNAVLHSMLLPYFATYAEEAHRTGVPIMRHTVLQYPEDPRSATAEYQYLLGDDLLVAPVIEPGATKRTMYLPAGEWVDYWTGEHYAGGKDVTVPAPIEQIPILVKAGVVLPFKPEAETPTLKWDDAGVLAGSLVWRVYPSASPADTVFTLPDGTSAHLEEHGSAMKVEGTSDHARKYEVVWKADAAPEEIKLDGERLQRLTPSSMQADLHGWWYESSSREVHAAFEASSFKLESEQK